METIEHKIGDTFCLEAGTKLEVIKQSNASCIGCYFHKLVFVVFIDRSVSLN